MPVLRRQESDLTAQLAVIGVHVTNLVLTNAAHDDCLKWWDKRQKDYDAQSVAVPFAKSY
jgi:hypothetical protein